MNKIKNKQTYFPERPISFEFGLKKAFTLVELIIVIVIIAVLATIAFISLQDYPRNARDGVRKSDLKSIEKAITLYKIEQGNYPDPDNQITPSSMSGWLEGEFGTGAYAKIGKLNKLPVDPVTKKNYTYFVKEDRTKFRLEIDLENNEKLVVGSYDPSSATDIVVGPSLPPLRTCESSGGLSFGFVNNTTKGPTGVVKDNKTGLMWESEGSNGETTTTMNWAQAKARCAGLTKGGFTDWRLPDITELRSIVNYNCYNPAVNIAYFSLANDRYWPSTTYAFDTSNAWFLYFRHGTDYYSNKSSSYYVLCIR